MKNEKGIQKFTKVANFIKVPILSVYMSLFKIDKISGTFEVIIEEIGTPYCMLDQQKRCSFFLSFVVRLVLFADVSILKKKKS